MTFKNNEAKINGGAMYLLQSTATFSSESWFEGNKVTGTGNGGAIYSTSTYISFSTVTFKNNETTQSGGAMYLNQSTATFTGGAEFIGNKSTSQSNPGTKFGGGALYLDKSSVTFYSTALFADNAAKAPGGVIYIIGNSKLTFLDEALFERNKATSLQTFGGGVGYLDNSEIVFSTATFRDNETDKSGGVFHLYNASNISFTGHALFDNNKSTSSGGAIYVAPINRSSLSFTSAEFKNNKSLVSSGDALFLESAKLEFGGDASFEANEAKVSGGAIYLLNSTATFQAEASFENNSAQTSGGAMYLTGSTVSFQNLTSFSKNSSSSNNGGAVYASSSKLDFGGIALFDNNSNGASGAAMMLSSSIGIFRADSFFSSNTATSNGGALFSFGSDLTFEGMSKFDTNKSTLAAGGAMYLSKSTATFKSDSTFSSNAAVLAGGAIHLELTVLSFEGATKFETNNSLMAYGGALNVDRSILNLKNGVLFSGNTANTNGGAIYSDASKLTIENYAYFKNNEANISGGALYLIDSTATFQGTSIFEFNKAEVGGGAFYLNNSIAIFAGETVFQENKSVNSFGGAIYSSGIGLGRYGGVEFKDNVIFRKNESGLDGGAILAVNSSFLFEGSALFEGNLSMSAVGGAMYMRNSTATFRGEKVIFDSNEGRLGGAIYMTTMSVTSENNLEIRNAVFTNNKAIEGEGGAIYVEGNASLRFMIDDKASGETIWAGNTAKGESSFMFMEARQVNTKINVNFEISEGKMLEIRDPFSSGAGDGWINIEKTGKGVMKLGGENNIATNGTFKIKEGALDLSSGANLRFAKKANTLLYFSSDSSYLPYLTSKEITKLSAKTVKVEDGAKLEINVRDVVSAKPGKTVLKDAIETDDYTSYVPGEKSSFSYFNNLVDVYFEESLTAETGKNYDLVINLKALKDEFGFKETIDYYRNNPNLSNKEKKCLRTFI